MGRWGNESVENGPGNFSIASTVPLLPTTLRRYLRKKSKKSLTRSTPSVLEVDVTAATAIDIIHAAHSKGFKQDGSCDGLRVSDTTYINQIDTSIDMDYHYAYLIVVCDNDDDGETWVSYLAVFQRHAGVGNIDYHWHESRHKFFDTESVSMRDVRMWFIDWMDDEDLQSCLKHCVQS